MFIDRINGWDIHVFHVAAHIYAYAMFNPDAAQRDGGWIRTGHGHNFEEALAQARGQAINE
jgi:hypothetical protein